jgi:carbon monoxide dehydrogenase subunit G
MTRLDRTIETRLGAEESFAFIADFANAMHWDPGVATSEAIDDAPVGVGKRYRLGVRMGSRVAPMEYRITTFEAPHRVVLEGEGSSVTAVDDIRFAPSGTGTRIDYTADIRLGGLLFLIQPFLGRAFSSLARNAVEGMRTTLDRRADA